MKELQKFILNQTNARAFFDERERPYEKEDLEICLSVWTPYLNPCGVPRWYLNHFARRPTLKRPEEVEIALEENLVHPEIAIWVTKAKMVEIFESLHNIQMEVLNQLETRVVVE